MYWVRAHPIASKYIIHIGNGGYRTKTEAVRLKQIGVRPGVSDYFLAYPKNGLSGLWVEMKRKALTVVSVEQRKWIAAMVEQKYEAVVAYGHQDAIQQIKNYLGEV